MIFDYSEYSERCGSQGIVLYEVIDKNTDLFQTQNKCPFCHDSQLRKVCEKRNKDYPEWLFGSFSEQEIVVQCEQCGWWQYEYCNQSDAVVDGIRASDKQVASAILKEYEESDRDVPIPILSDYINKHPEKIYSIHDKNMEKLVQSVFKDFFACNVELVGKSHDGGKDLIMIDSGIKTFIQVKRRMSKNKVESVIGIRELLGVSYVEDVNSCIFVSTADHFSKDAIKFAESAVEKRKCESFELIDCKRFLEMLKCTRTSFPEPWKTLLQIKG